MKAKRSHPHGWVGTIPLGRGSQVVTQCKKTIPYAEPVPLDLSDIPVGSELKFPDWVCADCRAVAIPESNERLFFYAVRDSRSDKAEVGDGD